MVREDKLGDFRNLLSSKRKFKEAREVPLDGQEPLTIASRWVD